MITLNLLPENYKSELNLEKTRRFVIFIFTSLGFMVVIFTFLLFAEFVFLKIENQSWLERLENEKATEKGKQILELEKNIKTTNEKISIVAKVQEDALSISSIIESLSVVIQPEAHLNSLTINRDNKKTNIAGFALTRDAVLSMEAALKGNEFMQPGTLISPKTNILKAEDIDFSFTFSIKTDGTDIKK